MSKIEAVHVFEGSDGYLRVIDTNGKIWKRHLKNGKWQSDGELPDDLSSKRGETLKSAGAVQLNIDLASNLPKE